MKTAQEARAATLEQIKRIASEFIINEVSNAIEKQINQGFYSLRMPLRGIRGNMENYASSIVSELEEKGYNAEVCDKSKDRNEDEVYINISWKEQP